MKLPYQRIKMSDMVLKNGFIGLTIVGPVTRDEYFNIVVEVDEDWDFLRIECHDIDEEMMGRFCFDSMEEREPKFVLEDIMHLIQTGDARSWIKSQIRKDLQYEKEKYENL